MLERKYSAYHEIVTVSNRYLRAAQKFLLTVERFHEIEKEIEEVRENTKKEQNAFIAISKIPSSGLDKFLENFDDGTWESQHSTPSASIRRLMALNGTPADVGFESILKKLDTHQEMRMKLVHNLSSLKDDVITNKVEFNSCKRELDSALGNIQLLGLPQITLMAQQRSQEITSWSNEDTNQIKVEDSFAKFIGIANRDLHESHTKSIFNRILRRESHYLKMVAFPNLS